MVVCRAGTMAVPRAVAGARHSGLLALRSASGVGLPAVRAGRPARTAFSRAGEKLRATGGELPRVSHGVGPRRRDGLALPLIREEGLGHPWRVRGGNAGQAASARQPAAPEATSASPPVSVAATGEIQRRKDAGPPDRALA